MGYSTRFSLKNQETLIIWYKISHRSNNLGRKLRKIGFFARNRYGFSHIISTNKHMWIYIGAIAKTIFFHTNRGGNISQIISCKNIHNHCRKHRKFAKLVILHNRTQISEKFSPIFGIFSSATAIVQQTTVNCSYTKIIKAAISSSYIYCEGIYDKVLQTHTILFKCTIVVTGVRKSPNISAQNTEQINLAYIVNYNENISQWLVLLVQKAAFL